MVAHLEFCLLISIHGDLKRDGIIPTKNNANRVMLNNLRVLVAQKR